MKERYNITVAKIRGRSEASVDRDESRSTRSGTPSLPRTPLKGILKRARNEEEAEQLEDSNYRDGCFLCR